MISREKFQNWGPGNWDGGTSEEREVNKGWSLEKTHQGLWYVPFSILPFLFCHLVKIIVITEYPKIWLCILGNSCTCLSTIQTWVFPEGLHSSSLQACTAETWGEEMSQLLQLLLLLLLLSSELFQEQHTASRFSYKNRSQESIPTRI